MQHRHNIYLLLALMTITGTAFAGPGTNPASYPTANVLTERGPETFHVANLDAQVSPAWRDNSDLANKYGYLPGPAGDYELSNRVIVRTNDLSPLQDAGLTPMGAAISELAGPAGYWIVTTASVRTALETAARLSADGRVTAAYVDMLRPTELRTPNDPLFSHQWHLENLVDPEFDANIARAWNDGYTGIGVTIGIVEGGWQYDHPDLAANYNAEATQPGGSATYHATSCAGVAAAVGDNGIGVVGAAYGAQLSGQITGFESDNAAAFAFRNDINDIKNNSWGPPDNGRITYFSDLEKTAITDGVTTGRDGLGVIYVWAAGNGGTNDRVEYDPYASSRYTCAIGSIGDLDYRAYYNETGSSMLAVAQSSGNDRRITTTAANSGYTEYFGGTSSASPLAAGVIALMLEANPNLTWRDVQHVLINSTRICDPEHADWSQNAAGHLVNYNYGFGAIDAGGAVTLAANWTNAGPETEVAAETVIVDQLLPDNDESGVLAGVTIDQNIRIESIELIVNATTDYVGDLHITLTAPSGTESIVAVPRTDPNDNYDDYLFTSLRHWDEWSAGQWTVQVSDRQTGNAATWSNFRLLIHGTIGLTGDLNCDGTIDFDDIDPFIAALGGDAAYYAAYPDCNRLLADINGDGNVDFDDIDPFVALLGG